MMSDVRVTFPSPCSERWETMTPAGRHRACAKCDRVVHDLSQYDVTDVEKLLREEPDSCVRARIASGVVATKAERHGNIRRMVAAIGASAGLLISPPVMARNKRSDGAIVGTVLPYG